MTMGWFCFSRKQGKISDTCHNWPLSPYLTHLHRPRSEVAWALHTRESLGSPWGLHSGIASLAPAQRPRHQRPRFFSTFGKTESKCKGPRCPSLLLIYLPRGFKPHLPTLTAHLPTPAGTHLSAPPVSFRM